MFAGWIPREDGTGRDHWVDGQVVESTPYTPEQLAAIVEAKAAEGVPAPLDVAQRVEVVESQVADLDAIIVAVLS